MELRIGVQGWQFLVTCVAGVALAVVYDVLWGLRRELKWMTHVGDLLFGITVLVGNVLLMLYVGEGEYRIFFPIGIATGFVLWTVTVRPVARRGIRGFWRGLLWLPRKIYRILKKIVKILKKFFKTPFSNGKKSVKIKKQRSLNGGECSG